MDFDLSSKHKKETEKRRQEAKRKLDQQRRDDALRATMAADQHEREAARVREEEEKRLRAEEDARMNDGVSYQARLRPYPSTRTDDKLVLPPSALAALEQQGAIEKGTLLTFAVSLPSTSLGQGAGHTHAGVAEFTAEEGTVGLPPRVALCLTKGSGLDSLGAMEEIEVRYVRLPRSQKSLVKFQPRGEGFHAGGMQTMRMDLEHVLQTALQGHTALSVGDWFPIRHLNRTFELVVRELEPEQALALLDTDLTVEVMPSEQTEAEQKAEEERVAREEAAAQEAAEKERLRIERAQQKAAALKPEPEAGPNVGQLLVRLPDGGRISRNFFLEEQFSNVLDWIESEPSTRVAPGEFRSVQKVPGQARELGPEEAQQSLKALGFQKRDAVFLQRLNDESMGVADNNDADELMTDAVANAESSKPSVAPVTGGAWSAAEDRAHEALDRRLEGESDTPTAASSAEPQLQELRGQELVAVFHRLEALGMPAKEAAVASKKYAAQLKELGEMGFEDWIQAVELLQKYNGRLLRVANLLTERALEGGAEPTPAAASAPPRQLAPSTQSTPSQVMSQDVSLAASAPAGDHTDKLNDLAAMGFTDAERNKALLTKHAGRVERVVEALISG